MRPYLFVFAFLCFVSCNSSKKISSMSSAPASTIQSSQKQLEVVDESPTSVTVKVSDFKVATSGGARTYDKSKEVQLKDFTAENFSKFDSTGEYPVLSPSDAPNIFTEEHGVYSVLVTDKGITKIIVNMVGLYPFERDSTKRYTGFRLNKYLDIAQREEALRFPKQGGEVEIEFIIDNAGLSLYLEGDFTNLGRDYDFAADDDFVGISSFTDVAASGRYSVKYKIVIPPARIYTTREVFACHWTCSYGQCYYGVFNLVVVQDGSSSDKQAIFVG